MSTASSNSPSHRLVGLSLAGVILCVTAYFALWYIPGYKAPTEQIRRQIEALKQGAQIVIGTPGRVLDLISRKLLILDNIRIAVLDEADRMLDIGFRPDIEKILRRCPTERQTLLLSATLPVLDGLVT